MRELLKKLARPLLRVPVVGRLLRILQAIWRGPANTMRLEQVEGRFAQLSGTVEGALGEVAQVASRQREIDVERDNLVHSVPGTLDRLSTEQTSAELKLEDLSKSLSWLQERVEFVRSEVLFEFRYRHGGESELVKPVETQVKIDLASRTEVLRVNLGCGHVPLPGYVNVDNRDLPSVDVVADVYAMPFEDGTVAEFFSSHFLEHFPLEEFRRRLLPTLRSKLAPGGTFRAVVPDVDAMMRAYVAGNYPYDNLRLVVYGGQDYDGDFHYNMFTPSSLAELLTIGGFSEVTIVEAGRVNGKSLEFEIEAIRD